MVASHNKRSMEFVISHMEQLGVSKETVYFGQLLGMADHLTFPLGANGYKAYKYVPYGPIGEVMPYLIRRTQENSTLLGSPEVQDERVLVANELRRRFRL
jgi:proline dehydrogenase